MSTLACTISGNTVSVKNGAFEFGNALETRAQLQFTVEDSLGVASYTRGQPVVLTDSVAGVLFRGFISSSKPTKLGLLQPDIEHEVTCIDKQYLLDKRTNTKNYQGWYAGDIVADMIESTLSDEGVSSIYAIDHDTTAADFATGTLTNTVATTNVGDGCLELAKSGSNLSFTETTTSDFASGTLTNVTATNNTLVPNTVSGLEVSILLPTSNADAVAEITFWTGSLTLGTNDTLNYDIWIASSSPEIKGAIFFYFSDNTTSGGLVDQNNVSNVSTTDLSNYAKDQWYSRTCSTSAYNGKSVRKAVIKLAGTGSGTYTLYIKDVFIGSHSGTPLFGEAATTTTVNPIQINTYLWYLPTSLTGRVLPVMNPATTSRISPLHSIDAVKLVASSSIVWNDATPDDSAVDIAVSYDGGSSYAACTNNAALPALPAGSNVAGRNLVLKETFRVGTNPSSIPVLHDVTVSLISAVNATKSDIVQSYITQANWNTGTHSNTTATAGGDLVLGTLTRNWNDNLITNQTFFAPAGTSQAATGGAYTMTTSNTGSATQGYGNSRLDFCGSQILNFTLEVDMKMGNTVGDVGVTFRNGGNSWQSTINNTFAYAVTFGSSAMTLYAGSNGSTDGISTIASAAHSMSAGTFYHLKIVATGNVIKCYWNNEVAPSINVTDTNFEFLQPGGIGLRFFNHAGGSQTVTWDNLEFTPAPLGTWLSGAISLASLGTCGPSAIYWTQLVQAAGNVSESITYTNVETSVDGGSTFQTCTNGGAIPNLPSGTNVSSKTLTTRVTFQAVDTGVLPLVRGLVWRVLGAYPMVSGTRITAPLGNDTMVRSDVVGSWGTAFDSQTYTKTGTGTTNLTSNKGVITNTTGDVHMRLGSRSATDTDGDVRFSISASAMQAGIELRYTDANNFYRFATSGTSAYLQKVAGGSGTVLGSTSVSLSTSTLYRMRFRVSGSSTTSLFGRIWQDGTLEPSTWTLTATDASSPLLSGGFALYGSGTGTTSFDQFRVTQYPDPSLSLAPVLPRLGTSLVSWNATVPSNTTLAVRTSLDGVNWSTATSGASITGLASQPAHTLDSWTTNTSANYTSTNKSGGSVATWTYDTANSRITASGGSSGLYIYNAITDDDVDVLCDMDRSDAGGLVWRYVDTSNYYELGAYDDSSTGGFTNQLRLYKVASGTRSLLGTASVISWPRSTAGTSPYKRIRVTMLGAEIRVYFDGALMQTYTDGSPLGSGKVGLRNDGGESRYYQLRIQPQGDYVSGTPQGDTRTGKYVYTEATLTTTDPTQTPQMKDQTVSARGVQLATGALIPQLHDPDKPFAEFFSKELESLVQSSGDYFTNIDKDGVLSFQQRSSTPAPWCLHSSDLLFEPSVTPTSSADLYRNRQRITNCIDITSTQNEQKVADGSASSWTMAYPLYSVPTVTVDGISKTVGLKGVDIGRDFYWAKAENSIGQDESAIKLAEGAVIDFSYIGQFDTQVTRDNTAEQTARAAVETGTTGIVEAIEDGKGMLASAAETYADGLLARYSRNDAVQLEASTQRSGLAPGQILPVFISEHGLFDRQLLITGVSTEAEQKADGNVLYTYHIAATDGANLTDWTSVFFG